MKAPICGVCLKSGILCRKCLENLENGIVSDADVGISRKLLELSGSVRSLKGLTVRKVVETAGLVLIITAPGDASRVIGREGLTVKKLERALGKAVKIAEETDDQGRFVSELLHPARVAGVNVLYRPEGEFLKVAVARNSGPVMRSADLDEITRKLFGRGAELELV